MSSILSFDAAKKALELDIEIEIPRTPTYSYASFGPTPSNCYQDLSRCVKAAMDMQIPFCDGADMFIFEGTTKTIICVVTFYGVSYTDRGRQFLEERGIEAA